MIRSPRCDSLPEQEREPKLHQLIGSCKKLRASSAARRPETKRKETRFGGRNVASAAAEFGFVRVAGYRLYGLDPVNKVASGEWFEADDDETAIAAAKEMMDGVDCELWQGTRRVARIPHEQKIEGQTPGHSSALSK
jgi:hypothetical protein